MSKEKETELKVLYYVKRNQRKANGLCPIMGRITIGRSVAQFSLKLETDATLWDSKAGRLRGKSSIANETNRQIEKINTLIHTRYAELCARQKVVTADEVKNAIQGIGSAEVLFLAHFRQMNEAFALRVGVDKSESAYKIRCSCCNKLQDFIRIRYKLEDVPFRALTYSFIEDYYTYLRTGLRLKINTANHLLSYMKQVTRSAVTHGYLSVDPFEDFKGMKWQKGTHKRLTKEELEKIMSVSFEWDNVKSFVRDLFVLACFTGMAYADIKKLKLEEITTMGDGSRWVVSRRRKSHVPFRVKLMDIPLRIIDKYKPKGKTGPVFPNIPTLVSMNYHLTDIACRCCLGRRISFHMGRHSFASLAVSEGVPIETVSSILGHAKIRTTQIYADLSLDSIRKEILALEKRLSGQYEWIEE
jgi:site-specific recombinase XerD